jgi:TRAP transporter TAXI family solute receptor
VASPARAAAPPAPSEPTQVSIGGGVVDSAAFRWSSALAQILSRPPGLPACDPGTACGVPGVVADARTYDQSQALAKALADGQLTTGILPALSIFQARCAAPKVTPALSVLKTLYRQHLQIVVRNDARIAAPKDLAGKTIAIGEHGSDSETATLALLDAYNVPRKKVKLLRLAPAAAVAALASGTATATIFLSHVFDTPIGALMTRGGFALVPLPDSPERQKLLHALPVFEADALPAGTYLSSPATSTVAQSVLWVGGPGINPQLAQLLVADVSEPHNLARLATAVEPVEGVPEGETFLRLPAFPDPGAALFAAAHHLPITVTDCPADGAR